ncbi:hypothetical protein [Halomonas denitrificans]|nr:hypothetical protein [Halomonas denitrificans]
MRKLPLAIGIASALAAGTAVSPALADEHASALKGLEDDTSITVSGTVIEAREDEFDLLVGNERLTVEIDDDIRDGGAYTLASGDRVTTTGTVDDDFFEGKELEATALYIEKLGTTFVVDEDYAGDHGMVVGRNLGEYVEVTGTVTTVSDDDEEFRLQGDLGSFTVEVDELDDDLFDDEDYLQVRVGDTVRVVGEIDDDWLEGREIEANSVNVIRVGS